MDREFNMPQLIQYVWDNDLYDTRFTSTDGIVIEFFEDDDWDMFGNCNKNTIFKLSRMERI
ncbi:hypothetical protein P3U41_05840 [Mammaliicoccus sciuri]|uniref:hypothetical protein n=1 Tax=Mammaliicoccus sciuri TaxID=1296 RepID=UPI002B262195|nr:hypothetical protein [Mammaliicoccus sciuri]WQL34291.1 hypothetical protein P3U41_05840 [Mammaliicoccus sciuri]WQL61230.1 hypothetical protein P3T96_05840 [Mammaliicoccus sciuri]